MSASLGMDTDGTVSVAEAVTVVEAPMVTKGFVCGSESAFATQSLMKAMSKGEPMTERRSACEMFCGEEGVFVVGAWEGAGASASTTPAK